MLLNHTRALIRTIEHQAAELVILVQERRSIVEANDHVITTMRATIERLQADIAAMQEVLAIRAEECDRAFRLRDEALELREEYRRLREEYRRLREEMHAYHEGIKQNATLNRPYFYLGSHAALTFLDTGQPFFVTTRDRAISPWIMMGGHWETFADTIDTKFIRPGMKVIDVGANMGYYSVKWGKLVGENGEIHAFEPNPEMIEILTGNVAINGLQRICSIYPVALGSHHHQATLRFSYINMGNAVLNGDDTGEVSYDVTVEMLDELMPETSNVGFMKIDAEGFEPEVLAGAQNILARSPECALHIEAQLSWERFRSVEDTLSGLLKTRTLYVISHRGALIPVQLEHLRDLIGAQDQKMVDLFLCPNVSHLKERIDEFVVSAMDIKEYSFGVS